MFGSIYGRRLLVTFVATIVTLVSCFAEPNGVKGSGGVVGLGGAGSDPTGGAPGASGAAEQCVARPLDAKATCKPMPSAESLYCKLVKDEPQDTIVFVDDLFTQFKANCGACHVDTNLGKTPFQANAQTFFQKVGQKAIDAIKSDVETCTDDQKDCLDFMPPRSSNGKPWSERANDPTDPLKLFVDELETWLASKKADEAYPPSDFFILPASKGGKSAYPIDEDFAQSLTNLGTCIPDAGMVATEPTKSCELDAAFADMKRDPMSASLSERIGLPLSLQQTDLFTLDTAELARYGVIAYQPTYPLWTDDAGKLRYIRVPRGTSVKYDPQTKTFDIPENTRFYKTFLKQVKALDGQNRYRKIETRVIVSRKNGEALYGSYEWNDEETQATLVTSPLRDGQPFTDVLKTLIIDEPKGALIKAQKDAGEITNYTYELDQQHAVRRYAIPGSERCIQCHMGNESFVLGFSPLQLNQRPCDKATLDEKGYCDGGILREVGDDEASQLQRLIDYGVITGITPDESPKLEDPQGPADALRHFRTPQELVAQSYMLGNCAHCHNPIGYPTMANPELKPLLNFLPVGEGGIFEFPLERYSPRIKRGADGNIQLPYITPSLRDISYKDDSTSHDDSLANKWTQKKGFVPGSTSELAIIEAPWRSLIYRNVDTPFTYTDNFAIYPHMPLNSPGFDCRAPRILGDWMVSIPAVRKHPELSEDLGVSNPLSENDPQPYLEVKPDDPKYASAVQQSQKRLDTYHKGERYAEYCPDTRDIIDLDVLRGKRLTPIDGSWLNGTTAVLPKEGVPDHPHWVVTDLTETPGEWTPRRTDWKSVIVDKMIPPITLLPREPGYPEALKAHDDQLALINMLQSISLTSDFRAFGLKKIPFGFWETDKHDCSTQLASVPKLAEYETSGQPHFAEHMRWMDDVDPSHVKGDLPIYESTPGQAVFNMICVNCHGPNADSKGRQATTLQEMTGGTGRVANFRNGLFGPTGSGGANRMRVFGSDDVASHYLAWMALGGTQTKIPSAILDLVNQTPVLGQRRPSSDKVTTANMLQVAQSLCRGVARLGTWNILALDGLRSKNGWEDLLNESGLIVSNGDAELWQRICTFNNPAPIHVLRAAANQTGGVIVEGSELDLYDATKYPAGQPIGDSFGGVQPQLTPDSVFGWCLLTPTDPAVIAGLANVKTSDNPPQPLPQCPAAFIDDKNKLEVVHTDTGNTFPGIEHWSTRGAINAGLSVFIYLDWLVSQDHPIPPRYNECEMFKP